VAHNLELLHEVDSAGDMVSVQRRHSRGQAQDLVKGPYPELRIIREVNFYESDNWNDFLNEVGSQNRGKGKAIALGSMACTLVSGQEMATIMRTHYGNKVFFDRSKLLGNMRKLAANFNGFVELNLNQAVAARNDMLEQEIAEANFRGKEAEYGEIHITPWPIFEQNETESKDDDTDNTEDKYPRSVWESGSFAVKGVDRFGRNEFGLDLSGDKRLASGNSEVINFLRHEGLPTHLVDRMRKPHLVFFEPFTHLQLGHLRINNVEIPKDIVLNEPIAIVNPNGNIE